MASKTPLYQAHVDANARIVDFGGWDMPLNYGSQIDEHHAVRQDAGMFDVSHMTVTDILGQDALAYCRLILANDISKTRVLAGKAIYSCILNDQGGVIDDLIAYRLHDDYVRIVSNAGTRTTVREWLHQQAAGFDIHLEHGDHLALMALQGPHSEAHLSRCEAHSEITKAGQLKRFQGIPIAQSFVGRTGYTGEDGFEIIGPAEEIVSLWRTLADQGVRPCGLGARDTLRLEAGMALYGHELDDQHTPIECGLTWTVDLDSERNYIGKSALQAPPKTKQVGLVLLDKGILRQQQVVRLNGAQIGVITSGTFSPTLQASIGLARIDANITINPETPLEIEVRKKLLRANICNVPFVRNGKRTF